MLVLARYSFQYIVENSKSLAKLFLSTEGLDQRYDSGSRAFLALRHTNVTHMRRIPNHIDL